jgi:hypothetical protein
MWTITYTRLATQQSYAIPRGAAAEVTAAIMALSNNPLPVPAFPAPDLEHTYVLPVAGHYVTYELMESKRIIKILVIE